MPFYVIVTVSTLELVRDVGTPTKLIDFTVEIIFNYLTLSLKISETIKEFPLNNTKPNQENIILRLQVDYL